MRAGFLRQTVARLHAAGIERAHVTCDDADLGSIGTIEACGGELERVVALEGGNLERRYRIG